MSGDGVFRGQSYTRKELLEFWDTYLGIPEDSGKPRTADEEARLAELQEMLWPTPAPLMVEVLQAQLEQVLSDLDGPISKETAAELYLQAVELQAAIERENGAIDDYAFGRELLKDGPL